VGARVVAVIDWRAAARVKDSVRFLRQAGLAGRVGPKDWRAGAGKYRSLVLRDDGSCELQRFTAATVARRLGGTLAKRGAGKAKAGERG
jgi:hypothetical protein